MSDQGFDFGPTPPRREARQFEPPPWERDQFERQKREQAERDAAAQQAREKVLAEEEAARAAEPSATGDPGEAARGATPTSVNVDNAVAPTAAAPKAEVDEKQVAMMMLGLRAEEPEVLEGAWLVNLVAGGVVALIGFATTIWGVTALAKRGLPAAGTLGAVVLLGFGMGFLGIGGWLVFKALRQRGVL